MAIVHRTSSNPHALTSSVSSASPPHQASTPPFPSRLTRSPTLSLAINQTLARHGQANPGCRFTFNPVVPLRRSQQSNFQPRRNRHYNSDHGTSLEKGPPLSRLAPLCRLRLQAIRQRHQRCNPQSALPPLRRVVSSPLLHCSL